MRGRSLARMGPLLLAALLLGSSCGRVRRTPAAAPRPLVAVDQVLRFQQGPPPDRARYFLIAASSRNANFAQEIIDQRRHWLKAGARPEEIACYYVAPFQEELEGDREQFLALAPELHRCYPASMKLVRQHLRAAAPALRSPGRPGGPFLYLYVTGHGTPPVSVRLQKSRAGDDEHEDLRREARVPALDQYQIIMESLPDGSAGSREVRGALRAGLDPREVLLTPAYLTELLAEHAAEVPKLVVLQGCHSGGFVEQAGGRGGALLSHLGHITVLAAARADRQSFGCQDGERATYFGGLLAEVLGRHAGLPPVLPWRQIHAEVARRVEQLETERKEPERSLPVFHQAVTAPPPPPAPRPTGWLKLQTHAHSSGSGDSQTPPAMVAAWYARHGFDAVVLTDHNVVTPPPAGSGLLVLPGVELTQNLETCLPPAQAPWRCLLHVNGLLWSGPPGPVPLPTSPDQTRLAILRRAVELARRAGGLVQVNHPNFHFAIDGPLLIELARASGALSGATPVTAAPLLLEVANQSGDVQNPGDADHPDTETLWDQALTAGARYFAVASDDAHHYDDAEQARARGEEVYPGGRGFLMVRASRDAASVRRALQEGEFYASTGVILEAVERSASVLAVTVAGPGEPLVRVVSDGKVVSQQKGRRARFELGALPGRYARLDISDAAGRRAWVQPVFLR